MLDEGLWKELTHISIAGVMGMATNTDDENCIKKEFQSLAHFFQELKQTHFAHQPAFKEISMGMSDDYPLAIAEGSTLVRIGSKIFGIRNY